MNRSLRLRTLGLAGLLTLCVLYLLPTFIGDSLPSWYYFDKRINLGLDLKGGAHFVYSIDLDKAVDDKAVEIKRDIETKLEEKGIVATVSTPSVAPGALTIKVADAAKKAEVEQLISSEYKGTVSNRPCAAEDGAAVCVRIASRFADDVRKRALSQAVKTVRERVDEDGIAEPTVIQKDEQIIVELPGLADEAINRVKELIARTAKLEFKIVANDSAVMKAIFVHIGSVENPRDVEAIDQGIKAYTDGWNAEKSGAEFTDYFLTANDRDEVLTVEEAKAVNCYDRTKVTNGKITCNVSGRRVLERYLAKLGESNPAMKAGDDFQFAYEYTEPRQDAEGDKKPFWRTYYLERAVRLARPQVCRLVSHAEPAVPAG